MHQFKPKLQVFIVMKNYSKILSRLLYMFVKVSTLDRFIYVADLLENVFHLCMHGCNYPTEILFA